MTPGIPKKVGCDVTAARSQKEAICNLKKRRRRNGTEKNLNVILKITGFPSVSGLFLTLNCGLFNQRAQMWPSAKAVNVIKIKIKMSQ